MRKKTSYIIYIINFKKKTLKNFKLVVIVLYIILKDFNTFKAEN